LKLLSTGSASAADVPPGWVVTQSPAAGTKVGRGRTVRVTLSGGPPLVPVPAAVVGTGLLEAQQLLVQAGLRVGSVEATGATLRVTATRPAPGESVATGAPVTLVVEVVPPAGADEGTQESPARRRR
jgi:serine/threonine-protein kinase